jgi:hypothetical protein
MIKSLTFSMFLLISPAVAQTPMDFLTLPQTTPTKSPRKAKKTHYVPAPVSSSLVSNARRHVGARWGGSAWCMRFANRVLRDTGYRTTGSDAARSVFMFPRTAPRPGVLAYWPSHTAILVATNGPLGVFISSNWSRKVSIHTYPLRRVHAFFEPQR